MKNFPCSFISLLLIVLFSNFLHAQDETIRQIVEKNYPENSLYIGATSSFKKIGTKESRILAREFSYTTPANDFKQSAVHPTPNTWRWEQADAWIKFAKKHEQDIRIHGPISPQCSRWTKNDERTARELEENLKEYMSALCKRYNDDEEVVWMDVVNETVSRDGSWKGALPGDRNWEMPWEKIGYTYDIDPKYKHLDGKVPLYIIQAFETATKYATNKKLIINQHGSMSPLIWNKIKDLVMFLREAGYRVDGIGWQAHISYGRDVEWESPEVSLQALKDLIYWAHSSDLEFHVTESNIHVPVNNPGTSEQHVKTYTDILNAVLEMRGGGVVGFNLWNIKDVPHFKNKKKNVIAPWDSNLEPKEIYFEIRNLLENPPKTNQSRVISYNSPFIKYSGRIDSVKKDNAGLFWSGTSVKLNFEGNSVSALMQDKKQQNYYNVILDEDSAFVFRPDTTLKYYELVKGLDDGPHSIEIFKRTEFSRGRTAFYGFKINGNVKLLPKDATRTRKIEFFGNSITAGYGNEDFEGKDRPDSTFTNNYQSYAAITARHFDAEYSCIAKGGIGITISWFDYTMPDIYDRTNPFNPNSKWDFTAYTPGIVVVNLFQNDSWLVKKPNRKEFKENFGSSPPSEEFLIDAYESFIRKLRNKYPNAHIICALGSMDATRDGSPWPGYITQAVAGMDDKKIHTHFFPFKNTKGHPLVHEHEVMANSLIKFIDENINW